MRSIAGPSRTRRPRNAKGSIRNGWIRSSGAVSVRVLKINALRRHARKETTARSSFGLGLASPNALPLLQAPGENTLLGMQPVLGLVPNYRLRAVDDPRGDLLATFCWQAMHEDRVWLGLGHKLLVDPISRQHVVAVDAGFNAHGDPGIGNDTIRAGDSLHWVGHQFDAPPLAARPFDHPLRRAELLRTGE